MCHGLRFNHEEQVVNFPDNDINVFSHLSEGTRVEYLKEGALGTG